eukprot:TRINITY_DN11073_c0_g2_i1.p2 TRINITY_DN11073_c0_g2~~TRINITY_DN11073_c0_g2_i1.p2  ORF type:complete len:186 (-),score=43.27 TRINITY_DN11073_c0_g2_i1:30-587(-)
MAARVLPTADQLQAARHRLRAPAPAGGEAAVAVRAPSLAGSCRDEAAAQVQPSQAGNQGPEVPEPTFSLTLRTLDGEDLTFEVRSSDYVRALRLRVSEELGVTEARVKFALDGTLLQVTDILGKAGVNEDSVLTLVVVPPVCQGSQVYNRIVEGRRVSEDDMEDMMARKAELNDAFARLRLPRHN